jgi:PAS domain S-box-containing protein
MSKSNCKRRHAKEELHESVSRLRIVVANMPVVLFALDRYGVFTLSEGKGLEALGLKPNAVVGLSALEVYRDMPQILEDVRRALAGDEFSATTDVAGVRFETHYSPLLGENGELTGVIGFAINITERKRAEEELREANRRLNQLAVLKADFTAMVAHELGAPLAAIRRLTEVLDAEETEREVRAYAIDAIGRELSTLDALITDVQASAAVERDDFMVELRPVALGKLLADAEAFANTLPGDPVRLTLGPGLEDSPEVLADPERMGQVLRNLLSNAAKYSPEGILIELRATRTQGRVRLEVVDHGPGIHPEDVALIFEKFGRGRDRKGGKIKGVGLGLYISRGIVRAHGGSITVESTPDEGAVFGFELELVRKEPR